MRRLVTSAAALAAVVVTAAAASHHAALAHPDFSGTWVLDTARTPASPYRPSSLTETDTQHGDTLRITRSTTTPQGDVQSTLTVGLDGKPWPNTVNGGAVQASMSTVATWADSTLVLTSTIDIQGQEVHQVERWTLSADHDTLTRVSDVDAMGQQLSLTLVLVRKGAAGM